MLVNYHRVWLTCEQLLCHRQYIVNSVLPLEAYLKIQTLHVKKYYFHTQSYQPNDFITSLWLLIKEILKFIKCSPYLIFHSGSFPCSFIRSWTPASGTNLVKNSPPNMMRPKGHCTTRQGKIIIFDYLEFLYKGVHIHTAQRCSLNPLNTFPTPKVKFTWLQRPWWRACFRNIAILDVILVIYCTLVSQATVFVTSHNTNSQWKGRSVVWRDKNGEVGYYLYAGSWQHNSGPRKGNNYLAAWLVSTLIKTLNFVSFSSFFCHVAQIQVPLTTLHLHILAIIGSTKLHEQPKSATLLVA